MPEGIDLLILLALPIEIVDYEAAKSGFGFFEGLL